MMKEMIQKIPTKKLNRIRLINWMYFGDETIPIGKGSVLISGENAAGKSALLDAVQMVLTGNTVKFNKAANENSDRDLKSYVRCKINTLDKTYLRQGNVISNVALEFYEEKEKRYFVIGVHLSSPDDTEKVSKKWYIQNGRLEDFSFLTSERKPSMPSEFRNKSARISFINTTREYKTQLAHRLGGLDEKFFEVLLKALAFRPVDNVKDFINQYVLAAKDIDVRSLRESIDTLTDLERTLKKSIEEKNALSKIIQRFEDIEKNRHDRQVNEILLKIAERVIHENEARNYEGNLKSARQRLEECHSKKESLSRQIESADEKMLELRQALNSMDFNSTMERLKSEISSLKEKKSEQVRRVRQLENEIFHLKKLLSLMAKRTEIPFSSEDMGLFLQNNVDERISPAKAEKVQEIENFINEKIENIRRERITLENRQIEITSRLAELEQQISQLEARKITFPANTEELRQIIQNEFDSRKIESHVYILAELLAITDKSWTNAIEGFLADRRFYLVIEPRHYQLAMEIYYANKKIHGQGIVNFAQLPENIDKDHNSLANYIHTENSFARNYADYILGNVICCDDAFQMEKHSAAITRDCMAYHDHVFVRIDPEIYATPYIGKDAIDAQLKKCRAEKAALSEDLRQIIPNRNALEEIEKAARCVNFGIIMQCLSAPQDLAALAERLNQAEDELAKLEKNPDIIELQTQIQRQEKIKKELDNRLDSIKQQIFRIDNEINHDKNGLLVRISETKAEIERMNQEEDSLRITCAAAYNDASQKFSALSRNKNAQYINENYRREQAKYDNREKRLLNGDDSGSEKSEGLYQMQARFICDFPHKDMPQGMDNSAKQAYSRRFETLSGYEIVQYEESVKKAKEKCEEMFKNDFISKMKEAIEEAHYEFEGLRKALKDINYGEDSYKFILMPNKNKESLYKMICSDDNLGGGSIFSAEFERRFKNEISELFDKIKAAGESDSATREYADYRSYLDYDIEIHKKNGTTQRLSARAKSNSGGESQVPFYVIMGASLNSIYRKSYCARLLLLDEAFSNMDEQRISAVMEFFKALGLQCILAAPSPKIQDIEEHTDSVLTVIREDTNSIVEDFRYNV